MHGSPQHATRAAVLVASTGPDPHVHDAIVAAGFAVTAEVDGLANAAETLGARPADLVLLDARNDGDPLEAAADVLRHDPEVRVVIIAADDDVESFLEAIRMGVAGYLIAEDLPGLARTLWRVLDGEAAVPRRYLPRLVAELRELD